MKMPTSFALKCQPPILAAITGLFGLANLAPAQNWQATTAPTLPWRAVAASADFTHLVATAVGVNFECHCPIPYPIYTSSDSGASWAPSGTPAGNWAAVAASADGTKIAAASHSSEASGYSGLIYTSSDFGATWSHTNAPLNDWWAIASSADGGKLIAASSLDYGDGLIYNSTNSGATWNPTTAPPRDWISVASSADGVKLVASEGFPGFIHISNDSGKTWSQTSAPSNRWSSVACSADGTLIVASADTVFDNDFSGDGLIYISTNSGANWTPAGVPTNHWTSVGCSADGIKLWAASEYQPDEDPDYPGDGLIYSSTNSGRTWITNDMLGGGVVDQIVTCADGNKLLGIGFRDTYNGIFAAPLWVWPYSGPWSPTNAPPPPPHLEIGLTGGAPTLSWLVPSTGFVLQQKSDVAEPMWTDLPAIPALDFTNVNYTVSILPSFARGASFYRLKQQGNTK
jgi:hypothetical protein